MRASPAIQRVETGPHAGARLTTSQIGLVANDDRAFLSGPRQGAKWQIRHGWGKAQNRWGSISMLSARRATPAGQRRSIDPSSETASRAQANVEAMRKGGNEQSKRSPVAVRNTSCRREEPSIFGKEQIRRQPRLHARACPGPTSKHPRRAGRGEERSRR